MDGVKGDPNCGDMLGLEPRHVQWLTRMLLHICPSHVSVLEAGMDVDSVRSAAMLHVEALAEDAT